MVAVGSASGASRNSRKVDADHAATAVGALDPERHRLVDPADDEAAEDPGLEVEQVAARR